MSRPAARTHYNQTAGQSLERISGLSDGIFAVAMTLLVLGIAVPAGAAVHSEQNLVSALQNLAPSLVAYGMSFLTLGIFWVGQGAQIRLLVRSDRHYAWLNLAFLMFVCLLPFTTGLLARFIEYRVALVVYWLNIFIVGAAILLNLEYAVRSGLIRDEADEGELAPRLAVAAMRRRVYIAQSLYAIATVLCVINTFVSITLIVLVQLNYAIAPRIPLLNRL
jgi:uncharacterized membrane protein